MDLDRYPRLKQFLEKTGMTLDQAHNYIEAECKKRGLL